MYELSRNSITFVTITRFLIIERCNETKDIYHKRRLFFFNEKENVELILILSPLIFLSDDFRNSRKEKKTSCCKQFDEKLKTLESKLCFERDFAYRETEWIKVTRPWVRREREAECTRDVSKVELSSPCLKRQDPL